MTFSIHVYINYASAFTSEGLNLPKPRCRIAVKPEIILALATIGVSGIAMFAD